MNTRSLIDSVFPLASDLRTYNGEKLRGDLTAGITVAIMLIPQGMAYAVLAGLPPVYGLYASLLPIILYALLGTSRQLAVGPVAMVSLLVLTGVSQFAEPGSERFIQLAILTALGVGLVQFLMGLFRMGFIVNFLSHPVLSGFISAAAIIIAASQIQALLGLSMERSGTLVGTLLGAISSLGTLNMPTAALGLGSILLIIGLKRWKKSFPGALTVVVAGILAAWLFALDEYGVRVVGDIPSGLPGFTTSFIAAEDIALLMPVILVIALISYLESIAVAKTIATKRGYELDSNKELIALGAANIGGAFFQSFPTTGGFSRTAVNDQVSSHTTISSLVSVALVALTVLFFTPLFYYLPAAVLGAIIMVAVFGLLDVAEMKHLWHTDRRDFALLMITFLVTLLIGIKEGIATGVVLSLTMVIYRSTRPQVAELGELGNTGIYRNVLRYPEAVKRDDLLVFRFDDALYFANASYFKDEIASKIRARGNRLKKVILVATSMTDIDSTGTQVLVSLVQALQDDGKELVIAGATGPVRDYLRKSGLMNLLGENHFFFDVKDAVEACSAELPDPSTLEFSPTQTN